MAFSICAESEIPSVSKSIPFENQEPQPQTQNELEFTEEFGGEEFSLDDTSELALTAPDLNYPQDVIGEPFAEFSVTTPPPKI